MEALSRIGIDPKILIAQVLNFAVVLYVLYRFLYKPLLKAMLERSKKIEEGVANAEKMSEELVSLERQKEEANRDAEKKSLAIVRAAQAESEENRVKMIASAREDAKKISKEAHEEIRKEKDSIIDEVRDEIIDLVVLATKNASKGAHIPVTSEIIAQSSVELSRELNK